MSWKKLLLGVGAVLLTVFVLMQFVPVPKENPPVTQSVVWDSPETEQLARNACYDCHSNETKWPWYTNVAPVSWRVAMHVIEGREHLNFSEWDKPQTESEEIIESITEGEMPLSDYVMMHSEADLTTAEQTALINGMRITFQQDPPIAGRRGEGRESGGDDDDD